ncbi:outer membrane murein-binding lipoprotein Lpp [Xanthomonas campestris]|nr:outer membrane murein-binding lipoprotein Lpp [Xanthomonas campestris]
MSSPLHRLLLCASCLGLLLLAGCGKPQDGHDAQAAKPAASATPAAQNDPAAEDARALIAQLREQLDRHRRIIVLLADEAAQSPRDRATSSSGPAVVP